jgi:flagellar biosynthesis/type III secretory pathway M-ring protein FliF/YscJ
MTQDSFTIFAFLVVFSVAFLLFGAVWKVALLRRISHRKKLTEAMHRCQKMESLALKEYERNQRREAIARRTHGLKKQ